LLLNDLYLGKRGGYCPQGSRKFPPQIEESDSRNFGFFPSQGTYGELLPCYLRKSHYRERTELLILTFAVISSEFTFVVRSTKTCGRKWCQLLQVMTKQG